MTGSDKTASLTVWTYIGLRVGLLFGFLAGLFALSNFNPLAALALSVQVVIFALLIVASYKRRRSIDVKTRSRKLWIKN